MKNNTWKTPVIILVGIITVIGLIVFWVQSFQNKAITLEEQVNTAQSDIEVQEKRRVDLVYNLADCVKQYDKHESETLKAVVEGRGSAGDIENVTTAITAVAEAYPELKSNENYKTLMNELSMTENLIAEHRRTDAFDYIDLSSRFFSLQVGDNVIEYASENGLAPQNVEIYYKNRYLGV